MRGIFWSHQFHDIKEDDGAGTNPGDEIDDDHDSTEHDTVGAPLAWPEDTQEDNLKDDVFCHFFWSSKTTAGGYAYFTTSEEGVKVEYIESDYDKIIYETLIPPRF